MIMTLVQLISVFLEKDVLPLLLIIMIRTHVHTTVVAQSMVSLTQILTAMIMINVPAIVVPLILVVATRPLIVMIMTLVPPILVQKTLDVLIPM